MAWPKLKPSPNDALKDYLRKTTEQPVTESMLRRILKEEFPKIAQLTKA